MSTPILVTGTIDIDPAQRDGFIAAAGELMAATHPEAGCEAYAFTADLAEPGRFHVSERWSTQAEMEAHMATPHLAAFMGRLGEFGVTGASLTKWEGATGNPLF